jgi:hypothetical protein
MCPLQKGLSQAPGVATEALGATGHRHGDKLTKLVTKRRPAGAKPKVSCQLDVLAAQEPGAPDPRARVRRPGRAPPRHALHPANHTNLSHGGRRADN